ncbi:acyl-CoA thioester hydrolase/BAAT C-terminal domain-containing protein [Humibacillus xanthopallidus]|uniref:Bile acid acyltransferase/acyl-CoA thioester hydrolase-like protein n=1 Tax=Humibacillus xanthopallidus TaxID=412689 RepID=A0A543HG33_9MICO|nr:acyl-CoA thioester hydrolase/BAAT C-terminal domain-containing protein [Humibacillus xanthopallidus]TQM57292.1 bile acid acyltransferase/acyl-CoA thioester hydrolase-like protein [Humibacillus xanthopallidus]
MQLRTEALPDVDGVWVRPAHAEEGTSTGVLVLSGSSGRVETERASVIAGVGATALTYRWFGAPGQPRGIWELPLESFDWAVSRLASQCDRVVLVGASKSAEAFLVYAADDPRVDAVIALSPSHVVWAGVSPGPDGALRPQHSSWSRAGRAVPFVPYDDDVAVTGDPPAFEPVYRASLRTFADRVEAATIPAERFFGDVLLVAGGDDRVWPSLDFARAVEARRTAYGLPTTLVTHPDAGHRVILPGEAVATGGMPMDRGGSESADRALGLLAWPEVRRVLGAAVG